MTASRVLIVGGDAAGMSAASRIARRSRDTKVVVFERENVISYAACGMPYHLDGRIPDSESLLMRSPEQFMESGIDVRIGHEVVDLNRAGRKILVRARGSEYTESYDALLIATGAAAVIPNIPGSDADGVFVFRRYADMLAIRDHFKSRQPSQVLIVGGGYIGIELADVFTMAGTSVVVAEATGQLLPSTLDPSMAQFVEQELRDRSVVVHLGQKVDEILVENGTVTGAKIGTTSITCELVVIAVGVRPSNALAKNAGIAVDADSGAILTDSHLRTSDAAVWAAGDCAASPHLVTGRATWLPLGPLANKQGRLAGDSMLGVEVSAPAVAGTALIMAFDLEIGRTGLTKAQIERSGLELQTVQITSSDRAPYYPGSRPTTILVHANKANGRILGAQAVGYHGVAGRTNVLATALHAQMTVDELSRLDLGYAPPFAPVWDPVLIAANKMLSD